MDVRLFRLLTLIAAGIWVLVLQNAGLLPAVPSVQANQTSRVQIDGTVDVKVVETDEPLDINLHSIVGRQLIESKTGMTIGVARRNTLIPIHWGEVTIVP